MTTTSTAQTSTPTELTDERKAELGRIRFRTVTTGEIHVGWLTLSSTRPGHVLGVVPLCRMNRPPQGYRVDTETTTCEACGTGPSVWG
jgi:hypothetical protein